MNGSNTLRTVGFSLGVMSLCLAVASARAADESSRTGNTIEEVVVTASKQGESTVLTTPIAIQAFSADRLAEKGAVDFDDYFRLVPGLSAWDQGPGSKRIILRGINAVGAGAVGLYMDEAVITGENSMNFGGYQPDPKLFDMERLEVLKGPQGTTFGSSAMSGVIRYITNKPDLENFSGTTRIALTQQTDAGTGSNMDAAVNLPLIKDRFAIRMSGFYQRSPGWIDDRYQEGINNDLTRAGRIEGRFKFDERAVLDLTAMVQNENSDGKPYYNLTNFLGQPLDRTDFQFGPERTPFPDHMQIFNATFNYTLDSGTITATASRLHRFYDLAIPASQVLASAFGLDPADTETPGVESRLDNTKNRTVESYEIRYASRFQGPIQILGGVFRSTESRVERNFVPTINAQGFPDPSSGVLFGPILLDHSLETHINETAGFGELTWQATQQLKLIGGARVFHFDNNSQGDVISFLGTPGSGVEPTTRASESSAIGRFNASYTLAEKTSAYLQIAQGYRPGGTNDPGAALLGGVVIPSGYDSDKLVNYEVGFKQSSFEDRLQITAAAYYIDWTNLQVQLNTPITPTQSTSYSYTGNAGAAKVKGMEFEAEAAPATGLRLTLAAGYTDAKISKSIFNAGNVGDRIPYTPKVTVSGAIDYRFPLGAQLSGFVGSDVAYISSRVTEFPSATLNYFNLDSYTLVNARAGVDYSNWTVSVIAKNLFNDRTVVDVFQEEPPITINGFFANAPRLLMLQVMTRF